MLRFIGIFVVCMFAAALIRSLYSWIRGNGDGNKENLKNETIGSGLLLIVSLFIFSSLGAYSTTDDSEEVQRELQASIGASEDESEKLVDAMNYALKESDVSREDALASAREVGRNFEANTEDIQELVNNNAILTSYTNTSAADIARTAKNVHDKFKVDKIEAYKTLNGVYNEIEEGEFPEIIEGFELYSGNMAEAGLNDDDFFRMMISGIENGVMHDLGKSISHEMIPGIIAGDEEKMNALVDLAGSEEKAENYQEAISNGGEDGREAVLEIFEWVSNSQ